MNEQMNHTYVSSTVFCIKMSQTLPWSGLLKSHSTSWFWFRVDFEMLVSEQFLSLKTALMTSSSWTNWRQGKNRGWASILSNYNVNRRMGSVFELSQAPVCLHECSQKQIKHIMTVSEIASMVRSLWDTDTFWWCVCFQRIQIMLSSSHQFHQFSQCLQNNILFPYKWDLVS